MKKAGRLEWLFLLELFIIWQITLLPVISFMMEVDARVTLALAILFLCYELCLLMVCYRITKTGFSISLFMAGIYFSIFLIYPGFMHLIVGRFPNYGLWYSDETSTTSALILLLFIIMVIAGYGFGARRQRKNIEEESFSQIRMHGYASVGLCIFAYIVSFVAINELGISNFISFRADLYRTLRHADVGDLGIYQAFPRILTFLSVFSLVSAIRFGDRRAMNFILLVIMIPIFLIINFPLALPRFYLFGYIISFIFLFIDVRKFWTKLGLLNAFAVGAFFLMPILNDITRRGLSLSDFSVSRALLDYTGSADFDGLQSINNVVDYVASQGVSLGHQMISAILFFVPREFWQGKAEATGSVAARQMGFEYLNISAPLPAEFYIDFGFFGVIAGAALFGFFIRRADSWIEREWFANPLSRCWAGLIAGFAIIFLRGALLGVLPVVGTIGILAFLIFKFGFTIKYRRASKPAHTGKLRRIGDTLTAQT